MTAMQRILVFRLGVAFAATLAFVGIYFGTGNPHAANAAWAFLALLALEKRLRRGHPVDERDRAILTRASLVGFGLFWVVFVLGCVSASVWASPSGAVPASILGFIPLAGYWLLEVGRSVAGLVLYARSA